MKKEYTLTEAKEAGLDTVEKLQSLIRDIDGDRELRDEFLEEDDLHMANETQNDILKKEIRRLDLMESLNGKQLKFFKTLNVQRIPGDGGSDFYAVEGK